jgi:methyl-accepting chemotaxis protein
LTQRVTTMKTLSLRFKLLAASIALLVLMALVLSLNVNITLGSAGHYISERTHDDMEQAVFDRLASQAKGVSSEVGDYINAAYRIPLGVATSLADNAQKTEGRLSRAQVSDLLQALLKSNKDVSSTYAQFEPNGYDGRDAEFQTSDKNFNALNTGSLEVYWVRDRKNNITQFRIENSADKYNSKLNEFGIRESEWFLCGRDTKQPCTMEPYLYEIEPGYSELMTSLTVPVVVNGEFRAITGTDVNLPIFQTLTENISKKLYDGAAKVTIVSQMGLIVASSHYQANVGRPLKEALPKQAEGYLALNSHDKRLDQDDLLVVSEPINITASHTQWGIIIELPKAIALKNADALADQLRSTITRITNQQVMIAILITLIAAGLLTLIIRSIVHPLDELTTRVNQLASQDGDLTQKIELDTHAELINLSHGFNLFNEKLRDMINALKSVSQSVRTSSSDSNGIIQKSHNKTTQQQTEISSVVAATNEMSATASEVANLANDSAQSAMDAQAKIDQTQKALASAVTSVQSLSEDMHGASDAISMVANRSNDIHQILDVIRAIAEQTNLLALNAAIEAARAGEQGRGFAVVADEVRSLASKTQSSTDEINTMIQSLQSEVNKAVGIIQASNTKAESSMSETRAAYDQLGEVVGRISNITDNVGQVATAAEEQSQVAEEINKNLTLIGDAAQDLARLADESQHSNQNLINQIDFLDQQLSQLRT